MACKRSAVRSRLAPPSFPFDRLSAWITFHHCKWLPTQRLGPRLDRGPGHPRSACKCRLMHHRPSATRSEPWPRSRLTLNLFLLTLVWRFLNTLETSPYSGHPEVEVTYRVTGAARALHCQSRFERTL